MKKILSLCLFSIMLSACAGGGAQFNEASIKKPTKSKAQFVIYRTSTLMGALEAPTVSIQDKPVCDLPTGTYFVTEATQGKVKISLSLYGGNVKSSLYGDYKGGRTYYIRLSPNSGTAISGGFGVLGAVVNEASQDDTSPYQLRNVDENSALSNLEPLKRSACSI